MSADHSLPPPLPRRIAVVGTGLIGSSWTALFLAHGLRVTATDPAPGAEEKLRAYIDRVWPTLVDLGLGPDASRDHLSFSPDLTSAVHDAQFVQEAAPEREEFKVKLFAQLDTLLPETALIVSSTSTLTVSTLQRECRHPHRCLIGHPFNPPHLIPLVEIVGGNATAESSLQLAERFYASIGKKTIRLQKEVPGHVANRLQAALWREAIHLVDSGVVSVADVDEAVAQGPGLRWALMGPNLTFHLGGGAGGMPHFLEHLAGPFAALMNDLGSPQLDARVRRKLIDGAQDEAAGRGQSIASLTAERDQLLVQILRLRAAAQMRE